jgi:hypothetical protein
MRDIVIWNLMDGTKIRTITLDKIEMWVASLALEVLDGQAVCIYCTSHSHITSIVDVRTGELVVERSGPTWVAIGRLDERPTGISHSHGGHLYVYDVVTGQELNVLSSAVIDAFITSAALYDRYGHRLAILGSSSGLVELWDLSSDVTVCALSAHSRGVSAVAVGQIHGRLVALSGSSDGSVRMWDCSTGRCISEVPVRSMVRTIAIMDDGCLAIACDSGVLTVDVRDERLAR